MDGVSLLCVGMKDRLVDYSQQTKNVEYCTSKLEGTKLFDDFQCHY